MGYDGYGVKIVRSNQDLEEINSGGCMAEELINIDKEVSVIICRSPKGETKSYPLVEMEFHPEANQVEYVLSPARITKKISQKAEEIAFKVSKAFKHVGLLAVELFLTKEYYCCTSVLAPPTLAWVSCLVLLFSCCGPQTALPPTGVLCCCKVVSF